MTSDDDRTSRAKRKAFGEKADLAMVKVVGSGISETTNLSLNIINDRDSIECPPAPWTENREMIIERFNPIFERSRQCPGRASAQCCKQRDGEGWRPKPGCHLEQGCRPKWREREDPEWYAREIVMLLSQVDRRIEQRGPTAPAMAADEVFELGCLFNEALNKFRWDRHAKRGAKIMSSAKRGGRMRRAAKRGRRSVTETVADVDARIKKGAGLMKAYREVARQQGVTDQTIRKEYNRQKRSR